MYRYRKINTHSDYSWDKTPESVDVTQAATHFLQRHAESKSSKTIILFATKTERYLILCYQEEGRFDSTGRLCQALLLLKGQYRLSIDSCAELCTQNWAEDIQIPEGKETKSDLDTSFLVHLLMTEGMYYSSQTDQFDFIASLEPQEFVLLYSTKPILFYEHTYFGFCYSPQATQTEQEEAEQYLTEYGFPLQELTKERASSLLILQWSKRKFLLGILGEYWTPKEHASFLDEEVIRWLWEYWKEAYFEHATSSMALFILKLTISDEEIRQIMPNVDGKDADLLLEWLKKQTDGYDLALQYFPNRQDIHEQIFPPLLQSLWDSLQKGIVPEKFTASQTLDSSLEALSKFRSLKNISCEALSHIFAHSHYLASAYKFQMLQQNIAASFLEPLFSNLPLTELPLFPPIFPLPNLHRILEYLIASNPTYKQVWLDWWASQQTDDLYQETCPYNIHYFEWSIHALSPDKKIRRGLHWKEHLSQSQTEQLIQSIPECSSGLLSNILGLKTDYQFISYQEAAIWETLIIKDDSFYAHIASHLAHFAVMTSNNNVWSLLSLSSSQLQMLLGYPTENPIEPWPNYMLVALKERLSSASFWGNWKYEDIQTHMNWIQDIAPECFQGLLGNTYLFSEQLIREYIHLCSIPYCIKSLEYLAFEFERSDRNELIARILSRFSMPLQQWLEGYLLHPIATSYPQRLPLSDSFPFLGILNTQQAFSFTLEALHMHYPTEEKKELLHNIFTRFPFEDIPPIPSPVSSLFPAECTELFAHHLGWKHWKNTI